MNYVHNGSSWFPGDIIYAHLLSKPVVVINSEEIAKDLFEGRPNIYSDKPQSLVYEPWVADSLEKLGLDPEVPVRFASDFNIGLLPYGDR